MCFRNYYLPYRWELYDANKPKPLWFTNPTAQMQDFLRRLSANSMSYPATSRLHETDWVSEQSSTQSTAVAEVLGGAKTIPRQLQCPAEHPVQTEQWFRMISHSAWDTTLERLEFPLHLPKQLLCVQSISGSVCNEVSCSQKILFTFIFVCLLLSNPMKRPLPTILTTLTCLWSIQSQWRSKSLQTDHLNTHKCIF